MTSTKLPLEIPKLEDLATHKVSGKRSIFCLLGPYKHGKSTMALTISEKCPPLPSERLVFLDDIMILGFDNDLGRGFASLGVSAPIIELPPLPSEKEYIQSVDKAIAITRSFVAQGKTKYVIVDTATAFNDATCNYVFKRYGYNINNLDKEPVASRHTMWGEISQRHSNLLLDLRSLGCQIIVVLHTKVEMDWGDRKGDDKSGAKKLSGKLPGQSDIVMAITGQAATLYRGQGSYLLPVVQTIEGGKKTYQLYTEPAHGIEGGVRGTGFARKYNTLRSFADDAKKVEKKE